MCVFACQYIFCKLHRCRCSQIYSNCHSSSTIHLIPLRCILSTVSLSLILVSMSENATKLCDAGKLPFRLFTEYMLAVDILHCSCQIRLANWCAVTTSVCNWLCAADKVIWPESVQMCELVPSSDFVVCLICRICSLSSGKCYRSDDNVCRDTHCPQSLSDTTCKYIWPQCVCSLIVRSSLEVMRRWCGILNSPDCHQPKHSGRQA